jgi:hypothetical protein
MNELMYVNGMAVMAPRTSLLAWPAGEVMPLHKPDLTLLDRSLRRGLSEVTRLFMHVALGALRDAHALDSQPHVIFASAFGEIVTAEAMLAQAFEENSASPARFRQSVHNTAEGLYSISANNREPATAIAAGWNTVAMGLLEARAQLVGGASPVLLVFAEEPVPEALSTDHSHTALAAAFMLSAQSGPRTRAALGRVQRRNATDLTDSFGAENHPLGPALSVARAIEGGGQETVIVGEGSTPYCIRVEPRARA